MGRKPKPLQPVKLTVEYVYVHPKEIAPAIRIQALMLRAAESSEEQPSRDPSPTSSLGGHFFT
jgi:hypothetical protein